MTIPAFLPDELQKRRATLSQQLEGTYARAKELALVVESVWRKPAEQRSAEDLATVVEANGEQAELLREQLRLLQSELELLRDATQVVGILQAKADDAVTSTEADIRKKLVKAGYLDLPKFDPTPGKIMPEMINRHPAYLTAIGQQREIRQYRTSVLPDWERRLATTRERIAGDLDGLQRSLAVGLA